MRLGYPFSKFSGIGDCGRQENKASCFGSHDDALLPDHTSLLVPEVVNLIVHDELHLLHQNTLLVQVFLTSALPTIRKMTQRYQKRKVMTSAAASKPADVEDVTTTTACGIHGIVSNIICRNDNTKAKTYSVLGKCDTVCSTDVADKFNHSCLWRCSS